MANGTECTTNYRDDNFFLFESAVVPCSLNQPVHFGLCCVWLAVFCGAVLEALLARIRNRDPSPLSVGIPYIIWVTATAVNMAYIVAVPLTTITNVDQAAILLTLNAVRLICALTVSLETNKYLTVSTLESMKMILSNEAREENERIYRISKLVLLLLYICFVLISILLLAILPQAMYNITTPAQRQSLLQGEWILYGLLICTSTSLLLFMTVRLREIIKYSIDGFLKNSSSSDSQPKELNKDTLQELSRRLLRSIIQMSILTVVLLFIYITAAIIGMRWWIYHINVGMTVLGCVSVQTYFRASFCGGFVGWTKQF